MKKSGPARIPKRRPPWHRMQHGWWSWQHLGRKVWTCRGKVGSTRAAPLHLGPPSPGPPRFSASRLPLSGPRAPALALRHLHLSTCGQRSGRPSPSPQPRARARAAGAGKNCVRLARVHTHLYSAAPPQSMQLPLHPSRESCPPTRPSHPATFPRPSPPALPRPPNADG